MPRVIGAIGHTPSGLRFSYRYDAACPTGDAVLWAMSDGTVRWRKPDDPEDARADAATQAMDAGHEEFPHDE